VALTRGLETTRRHLVSRIWFAVTAATAFSVVVIQVIVAAAAYAFDRWALRRARSAG
jgi:hypothetical protein